MRHQEAYIQDPQIESENQVSTRGSHTSETGLRGDLRSRTFGLLFFGVLLLAEMGDEEESGSSAVIFSGRAARGDAFLGTSGDPLLPPKHTKKLKTKKDDKLELTLQSCKKLCQRMKKKKNLANR